MAIEPLAVWSIPPDWQNGVIETLAWLTGVTESPLAIEQRMGLRVSPRQMFEYRYNIWGPIRTYFDFLVDRSGGSPIYLPLWHDFEKLTVAASVGSSTLFLSPNYTELMNAKLIFIRGSNPFNYEIAEILSVTDNSIELTAPLSNSWGRGTRVYPLKRCKVETQPTTNNMAGKAATTSVRFISLEPNSLLWVPPIVPVDTFLEFQAGAMFTAYCNAEPDALFFQLGRVDALPEGTFSGAIAIGISSGPVGATLNGTTIQIADFGSAFWDISQLSVSLPGTYTFSASGEGLTVAISEALEIVRSDNTICLDPPTFLLTPQLGAMASSRYMLFVIAFHQYSTFNFRMTFDLPNFASTCNVAIHNSAVQLGGTALQRLSFTLPSPPASGMYQMIVSADALTGVIQIVVNGVLVTNGSASFGGSFFFTPTDHYVQLTSSNNSGGDVIVGDLFFALPSGFFDLTISSNLDKLWDSSGQQPVDLSGDTSSVTGSEPIVYTHGDPTTYLTDYGQVEVFNIVRGYDLPFDSGTLSYASHGYP